MSDSETPRLAAGELELLSVLWKTGPVTISEAHRAYDQPIGYTTMQTRLNRLVKRGWFVATTNVPVDITRSRNQMTWAVPTWICWSSMFPMVGSLRWSLTWFGTEKSPKTNSRSYASCSLTPKSLSKTAPNHVVEANDDLL